ncbi:MAG TPA: hypothetical protein ENG71_02145 [Thermoplasmatales archaeon]|nr:hypothetical protein [Thermoplasmatales archaeon]
MMRNKGQVGVVVAILIVALLVSVLITIQVYYIPKWMKGREAQHMDEVANQFASLKYSLDLQAVEKASSPLTNSITLGSKELPYFVTSRAFGSLQILSSTTSNFSITIQGDGMEKDLQSFDVTVNSTITNISSLLTFEIYIENLQNGDFFNFTSSPAFVSIHVENFYDSMLKIVMRVINGSQIIFNQSVAVGLNAGDSYLINLLNEDYKISTDVIPYLHKPFNITFNFSSPRAEFRLKCYRYVPATVQQYNRMGTIKYEAENAYYIDQDYIYEGGAVILSQYTGDTMLYPPFFFASNATKTVNITLINVIGIGGKTGAAGYGTYSIRTNFSKWNSYEYWGSNFIINITTKYPSAWKKFLEDEMEESGLTYTIEEGNEYVKVQIQTKVILTLNIADICAQIGPGWVV